MLFNSFANHFDDDYKSIRNNPSVFIKQKDYLEDLWNHYSQYADNDFLDKFPIEFHQRFWEMYLTRILELNGHKPEPKINKIGPDICLNDGENKIFVEAIAPELGTGSDAVPFPTIDTDPNDPEPFDRVPEDKIVLRFTSAIREKWCKLLKYNDAGVVSTNDTYIIAVNGGAIPYTLLEDEYIPYIVRAVIPFADPQLTFDTDTLEITNEVLSYRPSISNKNDTQIPTTVFTDTEYSQISGIIYSNANPKNAHSKNGKEFIFVHNQQAINKLSRGWMGFGNEYIYDKGNNRIERKKLEPNPRST